MFHIFFSVYGVLDTPTTLQLVRWFSNPRTLQPNSLRALWRAKGVWAPHAREPWEPRPWDGDAMAAMEGTQSETKIHMETDRKLGPRVSSRWFYYWSTGNGPKFIQIWVPYCFHQSLVPCRHLHAWMSSENCVSNAPRARSLRFRWSFSWKNTRISGSKGHQMAWAFDPVQTHKALPNERTQHGKHMGSSWGFSRGVEWV